MKHIKIDKAKRLQDSIAMWSNPKNIDGELFNDWELQNEDGTKHQRSDEFVNAVREIYISKLAIEDILK